jgi:acyl dehydratase
MSPEQRLEPVVRTISLTDMVRYAGATWDWHQLHYDHDFLASIGLDRPVVDGQMLGALMADQLEKLGRVESLEFRFRSMVFAGEEVTIEAEIESVDDGEVSVRQTVKVGDRLCVTGGGVVEVAA